MLEIQNIKLNETKNIQFALTSIYGIGLSTSTKILKKLNIDRNKKIKDLTSYEVQILRIFLNFFIVDIELRKNLNLSLKKLIENKSYKGKRLLLNLPVNGQRTRTNAKTRKKSLKKK